MIGTNSTLRPIVNGAFLRAIRVSPEAVALKDEDLEGEEFDASLIQLVRHTRLAHGFTLCSVQGRTLSGTIALCDLDSWYFTRTHLYVGLRRATDGPKVAIAGQEETHTTPDDSLAQLRVVWQNAGRPG